MANLSSELRDRITIQLMTQNLDEFGGETQPIFIKLGEFWANAEPISNRKIRSGNETIVETYLFTIRPDKRIEKDQRILFQNKIFTIRAVDRTRRDRVLITAEVDLNNDRSRY